MRTVFLLLVDSLARGGAASWHFMLWQIRGTLEEDVGHPRLLQIQSLSVSPRWVHPVSPSIDDAPNQPLVLRW